jgi:hypothetical protein
MVELLSPSGPLLTAVGPHLIGLTIADIHASAFAFVVTVTVACGSAAIT